MKRNIVFIYLPLLLLLYSACNQDYLDKAPGVDVSEDLIFSSRVEVEKAIAGLYLEGMPSIHGTHTQIKGTTNSRFGTKGASDEAELIATWAQEQAWNTGAITPEEVTAVDHRYHQRWSAIRRANILLELVDGVPDADPTYKKQVKGEAKFMRAISYFEMLKRYGGVPIVEKRLTPADILAAPILRSSFEEVLNFIIQDCDEAIASLPDKYPAEMKGRATKGAALMVKAKALLLAASPQFNTATPYLDFGANNKLICLGNYDQSRWQKAAEAAKAVLDWAPSGGIALVTDQGTDKNYKYVWETHDNPELILINKATDARSRNRYPWLGILPASIYNGYGGTSPTHNFISKYEKKDGTPQVWEPTGGNDLNRKYEELDPRFAQTVFQNGSYFNPQHPLIQTFEGGIHGNECIGGSWQRKLVPDALRSSGSIVPNNFIYRLADAYLMYAEALNEAQGPTLAAYNAVNIIRNRSGMPNLPSGLTKKQFRDRVRNERAIEFVFEDNRLWDIMRWQIAEEDGVMQGDMWGLKIFQIEGSKEFRYKPYVFETRTFLKRMYLHPFLKSEVVKGYLVQNPGY